MKSHGIKYVVEINNALAMDKPLGDGRGMLGDWEHPREVGWAESESPSPRGWRDSPTCFPQSSGANCGLLVRA